MAEPATTAGGLDTLTLSTLVHYLPKMADNITNGPGFMRFAKKHKLIRSEQLTGRETVIGIDREDNTNNQWFDNADPLTVAPSSGDLDGRVGHYNATSAVYITLTEEWENAAPDKRRDLLDRRIKACERAMKVWLAQQICGTRGSDTKRPEGIRDLMGGNNPNSAQGTLHGLAPGTYDWWVVNCNVATSLGANNSGLQRQALKQFLDLQKEQGRPDVGICDLEYYQAFSELVLGANPTAGHPGLVGRTYSGDRPAGKQDGGGIPMLQWNGATIVYDPYTVIPSTYTSGTDMHINWIDSDHFHLVVDPRANFKMLKPRQLAGGDEQLVNVYRFLFRCQTRCYKRNAHGVSIINL